MTLIKAILKLMNLLKDDFASIKLIMKYTPYNVLLGSLMYTIINGVFYIALLVFIGFRSIVEK